MGENDFQITAHIRRILQRRSVDPSALEFGSVDGVAYLRGRLERLPGTPRRITGEPHLGPFLT
ncbi:MAG: hypothetical protein GF355_17705, partial [Candidatus Eisenbacteria bacterium]|nr:hypothetical protein [Candidatus Eisenbacteria bacterium]